MGSRRKGRILAMQALYAWEITGASVDELCAFAWLGDEQADSFDESTRQFSRMIIAGMLDKIEDVDASIRHHLENWDFDRIAKVDLAVLRLGVYSIIYQPDIPATVSIDEAIEIAKEFAGDDSYRFVNGILDSVRKKVVQHGG